MQLFDLPYASRARGRSPQTGARTLAFAAALASLVAPGAALADKISNPTAVFEGLDKITGRIITFEVAVNETVQFGALQITPRVCYSRPPTDAPQTDVFAQVDEIDEQKQVKRIFSGWMFADSPGLHGVEHPIFDVWLKECRGGTAIIHDTPPAVEASAPNPDESPPTDSAIDPNASPEQPAAPPPQPKKKKPKPQAAQAPVLAPPDPVDVAPLDGGPVQLPGARSGR
jgi:hypothetical protein